ncbi:MAG: PhzF family phenazine biosynthesis protein [Anaerolineaceae bacterium]|nr:PhzF family phenazine biosynthesis protein [Anaerolineaceae bacterium]
MKQIIFQVDSFSKEPFKGNPAGVCILEEQKSDEWMKAVAREMNLSETAFLMSEGQGYRLRWFTPAAEVDLCGHATLASAHILWESGLEKPGTLIQFFTRSGLLTASLSGEWIELNFPVTRVEETAAPHGLIEAMGKEPLFVGVGGDDYLLEYESREDIFSLVPDYGLLKKVEARGVIATCQSDDDEYDFISRFFAPRVGVDEDPVTGSAHCRLVPYWKEKLGKNTFKAYQASARGGELRLRLDGERVIIGGQAVTVLKGELLS